MADAMTMTGVTISYPNVPQHRVDRQLNHLDSGEYAATTAEANKVRNVLRMQIHKDNADYVLAFLESHTAALMEILTAGMYPFGVNYATSTVQLIKYSNLVRISDIFFTVDCELEFSAGVS